jgi:hypothetical protein
MADTPTPGFKCLHASCKFPLDGKCIEDLPPPNTCPNRRLVSDNDETGLEPEGSSKKIVEPVQQNVIKTHLGEGLTDEECEALMAGVPTKLIIIGGLKDSGKSTILGSINQLFQQGDSFADHVFTGSETLIGFERVSHDSRIRSGRPKSHTIRTVKGQGRILHLKVRGSKNGDKKDILFTNLSGEEFDDLSKSEEYCKNFKIGARADHFALVFDADRLSDTASRQVAKVNSLNVLMSLLDSSMLDANVMIDVIFSKWDRLLAKEQSAEHIAFINQVKADVDKRVAPYKRKTKFFEIASRPDTIDNLKFGHGLEPLFSHWTSSSGIFFSQQAGRSAPNVELKREMSKYKVTHNHE